MTLIDIQQARDAAMELFESDYKKMEAKLVERIKYVLKLESEFDKLTPQRVEWLNKEREFIDLNISLFESMKEQMANMVKLLNWQSLMYSVNIKKGEELLKYKRDSEFWHKQYIESLQEHNEVFSIITKKKNGQS